MVVYKKLDIQTIPYRPVL